MHRTVFEIAYEGSAVDNGTMDVRELAPSLLALGDLVENANKVIGDSDAQVKVVVKTGFKRGSFQIVLEMVHTLAEQIKLLIELPKSADPTAIVLASLGLISQSTKVGISLIKLLKHLRGRNIERATIIDNGNIRLEILGENGKFEYIEVDENTLKLYRDQRVRDNLNKVIKPLEQKGINKFSVREDDVTIESIEKNELPYFDTPDSSHEDHVTTSSRKAFVKLIEVAFEDNLKWRFSDGDNKFYASINDDHFLKEMEFGKSFRKGDTLEIELETTQVVTSNGIKNEHKVLKVMKHLSKPQQISIPFINNGKGDKKE